MTYNAASRKDIRAAEKASRLAARANADFITAAMSRAPGRAWFYAFLSDCGCFAVAPTFEPNRDYFAQGQRNVGMRIMAEILALCPDHYITMLREENVRSAATQQPRSPDPGRDDLGPELDATVDELDPEPQPDLFDPYASAIQ